MSRPSAVAFGLLLALAALAAGDELAPAATFGSDAFRHADGVVALDVAPDGRVVSGGKDGFARTWRPDGAALRALPGHGWVTAVRWLADGRFATAGWDGVVRVWGDEGPPLELAGHKDWVLSLATAGGLLASASRDGQVRVWDLAAKKSVRALSGTAVALAPDGKTIAVVGPFAVSVQPVRSRKATRTLPLHAAGTPALAFTPDGAHLLTAGGDGEVALWDLASGAAVFRRAVGRGAIHGMDLAAGGKAIACVSAGAVVSVLDASGRPSSTHGPLASPVHAVAFRPDGTVLCAFEDGAIADTARVSPTGPGPIAALAATPDGKRIAVAGGTRLVDVIDSGSGARVAQLSADDRVDALAMVGADTLATGGLDAAVTLWDVATGRRAHAPGVHTPWVSALAAAPDGKALASGAGSATIKHWSAGGRELATLYGHRAQVTGLAWIAGERVLSGSRDRAVGVWSLAEARPLATLKGHASAVTAVAASADGTRALSGGENGELIAWAPPREEPAARLATHRAAVSAVAMSADGALAASCDRGGLIAVHRWSDRTPVARASLAERGDWARAAAFLPGGRLAIGTARGLVWIYALPEAR